MKKLKFNFDKSIDFLDTDDMDFILVNDDIGTFTLDVAFRNFLPPSPLQSLTISNLKHIRTIHRNIFLIFTSQILLEQYMIHCCFVLD